MDEHWPVLDDPAIAVQAALQRASATVAVAAGLLASGRTVDLSGLDKMAGALCARILDLPPSEGLSFRSALEAFGNALSDLTRSVERIGPAQ